MIYSSPETIHSSPQSDIRNMQQIVFEGATGYGSAVFPSDATQVGGRGNTGSSSAVPPSGAPQTSHTSGDGCVVQSQPPLDSGTSAALEEIMNTVPIQDNLHAGGSSADQPSETAFDFSIDSQSRAPAQPASPAPTPSSLLTAQPMRHGREPTGDTPIPQSKRHKYDDYDLNVSPLAEGFHRQAAGSASLPPMVTPSVAPSVDPIPPCHTPPLATLAEDEVVDVTSQYPIRAD